MWPLDRYAWALRTQDAASRNRPTAVQASGRSIGRIHGRDNEIAARQTLGEDEAARDTTPDLESFLPHIVGFFDEYAPGFVERVKTRRRNAPRVLSITPKNGAKNVPPGLTHLTVTFNQPMRKGYSFVGGGPHHPEVVSGPTYTPDQTSISIQVRLKPNWRYELWLNRGRFQGFKNSDGLPWVPSF